MTSAINPNDIDGTYPVAGQDNNSQGFRDNFTNTKTNFQYAANEITDLQNKAVLKAALTGTSLNNNMGGSVLSNGVLQDFGTTRVALGSLSGSVTIDYSAGSVQTVTTSGSISLSFTNFPTAGVAGSVTVQISISSVAHTVTLPAAVSQGLAGIQGLAAQVITFAQTGTYNFEFTTSDNGTTVTVRDLSRALSLYTNPVFLSAPDTFVGNAGNVSLTSSTTVFTQAGSVVGNLNAGSSGQIKILAYGNAAAGNTVITVANAAWGGSNIANLSAVGSACTLQYVDSRWFCVGNNGCTFA
jgi:hypothetical protein